MENPICIYIHIPFCPSGCKFCHFYIDSQKKTGYIDLIKKEYLLRYWEQIFSQVDSVFIWWGTPNMLSLDEIQDLLLFLRSKILHWSELCIELHPALITSDLLRILESNWVTRISIWIQTLDRDVLSQHTRIDIGYDKLIEHIEIIQKSGLILNFDFIYDLVWDNIRAIKKNLAFIAKHKPESVNYYQFRPLTSFWINKYSFDDKRRLTYYLYIQTILLQLGYIQVNNATYVLPQFGSYTSLIYEKVLYSKLHTLIWFWVAATSRIGNKLMKNAIEYSEYQVSIEKWSLAHNLQFLLSEEERVLDFLWHIFLAQKSVSVYDIYSFFPCHKFFIDAKIHELIEIWYFRFSEEKIALTNEWMYRQESFLDSVFCENKETLNKLRSL